MELAGHKHLGTTQRYIEVNDDMKRAAVEVLSYTNGINYRPVWAQSLNPMDMIVSG